ncbi:hypothetical protein CHU95_12675 [Niveispirillum lacus]|uniref:DUF6285 domain-containing protein n=1 Tax=Niveispirillum lacus TaxID=1981099 RepID=A0A255YYH6_9PROT|nr:DUF6285 domain-containing protein [Niveispirillum lacus]OYQ34286.1 hypothetical protein CHU95_12675 [Niveispirillum lacus]
MTPELPDAGNLLETALNSLRTDLLPYLPDHARYTGLMVANALSIALRDLRAEPARAEMEAAMTRLIGRNDATTLCRAIQAGRFDAPDHDSALRLNLLLITKARLSINNPKALG